MKLTYTDKPKKADAFGYLKELHAILEKHRSNGSDIDYFLSRKFDYLINYFAPSAPKKALTVEQWVARAVNIAETRRALRFMCVRDGVIYGSDDARVHWGPTELADGFYDSISGLEMTTLAVAELKYPDVCRLIHIAKSQAQEQPAVQIKDLEGRITKYCGKDIFLYEIPGPFRSHEKGRTVYFEMAYVDQAVNGAGYLNYSAAGNQLLGRTPLGEFIVAAFEIGE